MLYEVVTYSFCFKQKTAYDMRISDWSSDVCSSDLINVYLLVISLFFPIAASSQTPASTPTFTSYPTLSPDGEMIVFSYEDDLWKVPVTGGQALRLTAMRGIERAPRISPDGQWLAFSANQFGNLDVYVMPMKGGEVVQLTHHDATDEVESWCWVIEMGRAACRERGCQ